MICKQFSGAVQRSYYIGNFFCSNKLFCTSFLLFFAATFESTLVNELYLEIENVASEITNLCISQL